MGRLRMYAWDVLAWAAFYFSEGADAARQCCVARYHRAQAEWWEARLLARQQRTRATLDQHCRRIGPDRWDL